MMKTKNEQMNHPLSIKGWIRDGLMVLTLMLLNSAKLQIELAYRLVYLILGFIGAKAYDEANFDDDPEAGLYHNLEYGICCVQGDIDRVKERLKHTVWDIPYIEAVTVDAEALRAAYKDIYPD